MSEPKVEQWMRDAAHEYLNGLGRSDGPSYLECLARHYARKAEQVERLKIAVREMANAKTLKEQLFWMTETNAAWEALDE